MPFLRFDAASLPLLLALARQSSLIHFSFRHYPDALR